MTRTRADERLSTRPSARFSDAPHLVAMRGRAAEPALRPAPLSSGLDVLAPDQDPGRLLHRGRGAGHRHPAHQPAHRQPVAGRDHRPRRHAGPGLPPHARHRPRLAPGPPQGQRPSRSAAATSPGAVVSEAQQHVPRRDRRPHRSPSAPCRRTCATWSLASSARRSRSRRAPASCRTSAEEVNASTDEVASSMEKIAEGAGQQSDLVERDLQGHRRDRRLHRAHGQERRGGGPGLHRDELLRRQRRRGGPAGGREGEEGLRPHRGRQRAGLRLRRADQGDLQDRRGHHLGGAARPTCSPSTPPSRRPAPASTAAASRWWPRRCASWPRAPGRSAEQISALATDISGRATTVVDTMKESVSELGEGREDLNAIIRTLEDISKIAATGADKVGVISEAAREQLKGSADMVQAMDHISDVATSNAKATEQVRKVIAEQTAAVAQMASAAQELSNLSLELQTVVSRFRLGRREWRRRAPQQPRGRGRSSRPEAVVFRAGASATPCRSRRCARWSCPSRPSRGCRASAPAVPRRHEPARAGWWRWSIWRRWSGLAAQPLRAGARPRARPGSRPAGSGRPRRRRAGRGGARASPRRRAARGGALARGVVRGTGGAR